LLREKRLQSEFPLLLPPVVVPAIPIQQVAPAALAYLGDAVYELYIRRAYLMPPKRLQAYHNQVVAQVRAERQADHLRSLLPLLTEPELEILKRGRNAATGHPKRVDLNVYQQATSLETLIGYLYLTDLQRLAYLLAQLELESSP
jgi:ribonuclease-3 family protein